MAMASAPGKIILFGEHSVVYHQPAIAVPVKQVLAQAKLTAAPPQSGVRIIAPDLQREFDLSDLETNPLSAAVYQGLQTLASKPWPDFIITVQSTIPIARGLGSGAAISTAIIRAIAAFLGQTLSNQGVSDIVYQIEKMHHGTPSGIDNTVVVFNQPIFFVRGQSIERLAVGQTLTFVIGDTGVSSPTYKVVGDLRRRWEQNKAHYNAVFTQMGQLASRARQAIESGSLVQIGKLMNDNQQFLQDLGISSPELDMLVSSAREAGAIGAKLSGAGWGGNMIALVKPSQAQAVANALKKAGAVNTIITEV